MADLEQTRAEVERRVQGADLIERLAERVGGSATVSAVFGEPVERDGITVIPVARAAFGFGGGSGTEAGEQGSGGGGGGAVSPLGHIEIRQGQAQFKPLRDPLLSAGLAAVAGAVAGVALRSLMRG